MLSFSFRYDKGAHLFLPSYVMRTHGARQQREAVKRAPREQMQSVFEVQSVSDLCRLDEYNRVKNTFLNSFSCKYISIFIYAECSMDFMYIASFCIYAICISGFILRCLVGFRP